MQDDRKVNLVKLGDGVKLPKKEVLCKIDPRRLIKNSNAPTDVSTAIARAIGQKLAGLSFLKRPLIILERERILRLLISFPKWLLRRGTGELHQLDQTEALNMNIRGMNLTLPPTEGGGGRGGGLRGSRLFMRLAPWRGLVLIHLNHPLHGEILAPPNHQSGSLEE